MTTHNGLLTESSIVSISDNQVSSDLDGESVILDLDEGIYYGLDIVGTRIWDIIKEPVSVSAIISTITDEYDVTEEQCKKDVLDLLKDLHEHGLIVVRK